jgi:amino acid transporter
VLGGLSALSLDALSSVAYGPEAMIVALSAGGLAALKYQVPLTIVITVMLVLLVVSYTQVIRAHPDGGGSYAVAKENLGRPVALLAAASLVVDYVLTVAVSLAAGAASIGSVFPGLAHHLLPVCLVGLAILTVVNLFGITESARLLMVPTMVFLVSILGVIAIGLFHYNPVALGGTPSALPIGKSVGIVLLLKAFANGCSAVTGVEAIANGVPAFKEPRVRTAQRTEVVVGVLLAVMLLGLSVLMRAHHVVERPHVTALAQVTAGVVGTGVFFYISNLSVALVLGLAANTSFGGLPVLMSLLARDHRLPHLFYLRAERPVYRTGIVALTILSGALLIAVNGDTQKLIPLFTIGVFIGLTISQVGLVRHWRRERPPRWWARAMLNGAGAAMTAVAVVVFLGTKFLEGAWVVVLTIPLLILMFTRIERYYAQVARDLKLGKTPRHPVRKESIVIVPTSTVNLLTEKVLSAALSMGETVVAVAVAGDEQECAAIKRSWDEWDPGVPIEVLLDPHRSLVKTVVRYIESLKGTDATITVLIPDIRPNKPWHEILHNQRTRLLESVLKARTDVVIAIRPFHIHD